MKARFKQLVSNLLIMALVISSFAVGPVNQISWAEEAKGGLIISEYTEKGNNKALELFNTSEEYLNLKDYKIGKVSNGDEAKKYYLDDMTGVVSPGAVVVLLYTKSYNEELLTNANRADLKIETSSSMITFNGDDPVFIESIETGAVLDYIGILGKKKFGEDNTFVRNADVVNGQTMKHSFDNGEWTAKGENNYDNIGLHTFNGIQPSNKLANVYPNSTDVVVEAGTTIALNHKDGEAKIYYSTSSDDKADFEEYTAPIAINEDTVIRAFAKKDEMLDSDVANFTYSILVKNNISEVRNENGLPAIIEGVVTGKIGSSDYYMQDDTAGIILSAYKVSGLSVNIGDELRVKGNIEVYKTMSQIHPMAIDTVEVLSTGNVVTPQLVTSSQVAEETEGELVRIENITIDSIDKFGNYTISDANGTTLLKPSSGIVFDINDTYESITGVVKYNYGHKIFTRDASDILWSTTKVYPVKPSMGNKAKTTEVESGAEITLASETESAEIYYAVGADDSISDPTPETGTLYNSENPIVINSDNLVIKAMAKKAGLETTPVYTFQYKLGEFVFAHDLQGEGHTSPFKNQEVSNVKGIITAVSYKDSFQKGLYIQTPDSKIDDKIGTSEGIFVKPASTNGFTVGDMVIVSGTVKEVKNGIYDIDNLETIIDSATINVVSSGNALPNSTVLGDGGRALITDHIDNDSNTSYDPEEDALDYYESLEGMLVKINDPVVVGMDERYGEFAVLADNGDASAGKRTPYGGIKATLENHNPEVIHIDDVIIPISGPSKTYYDSSFAPKVGDKFDGSIEGVMSFGFGKYKVLNTSPLPNLIDNGLEITNTSIVVDEDKLTIASFNIENFHKGVDSGKIEKIAKTIAVQLKTPDIVGVIEMQDNNGATNDGTTAADENATVLINAINNALTTPVNYKYVEIEPVDGNEGGQPGGNIRVAYIYNADRVSLYDAPAGSNAVDVVFKNGHLLNNPGRVATTSSYFESTRRALAAEFEFKGESVVVIANHLSSKRGDEGEFGPNQPPVKGSEPNRHGQAQALNDFIDTIMLDDPKANVVVLGDLNDYEYSETLNLLKGKGTENILTNMIDKLPLNERMTYIHNGNSQVLDHILVSNNLENKTVVDVVNANSMVTAASGRSSDHDPVMIQVTLDAEPLKPADNIGDVRETQDQDVFVRGIVTAKIPNKEKFDYYIQDLTGGLILSEFKLSEGSLNLKVGDKVEVTGKINLFYKMSQIQVTDVDQVEYIGRSSIVPQTVIPSELGESVEGELVKINKLKVTAIDKHKKYYHGNGSRRSCCIWETYRCNI